MRYNNADWYYSRQNITINMCNTCYITSSNNTKNLTESFLLSYVLGGMAYLNSVPVLSVIVFNSTCVTWVQHLKPGQGLVLFAPLKYKQEEILPSRLLLPKVHLAPDSGIHQKKVHHQDEDIIICWVYHYPLHSIKDGVHKVRDYPFTCFFNFNIQGFYLWCVWGWSHVGRVWH